MAALALAAWARFGGVGIGWFMVDQVRDAVIAMGIVQGTAFPAVGPQAAQSTLSISGPLYYYLLAVAYGISADPQLAFALSAALAVVAVYLTYRLGTEMFGRNVGATAALLYATFPMAIVSGLTLWNPGLLPAFSLAFLLMLWRYLSRREPWRLAATVFLLAILLNLHLSSVIFLLLLPLAWVMYRPPTQWRFALTGLAAASLLWLPYLIAEARTGFSGIQGLARWMSHLDSAAPFTVAGRAFIGPFTLPARIATPYVSGTDAAGLMALFGTMQMIELALLVAGLALCGARLFRADDRRPYVLLAAWYILPFVLIPRSPTGVPWYYFDTQYPSQFLLIGLLVDAAHRAVRPREAGQWLRRTAMVIGPATVVMIVAAQVWYLQGLFTRARTTGVLQATTDLTLDRPSGQAVPIETMTLDARRLLAEAFTTRLHVDRAILDARGHGARYEQFREGRGYLLDALGSQEIGDTADASTHYLVLGVDAPIRPSRAPTLNAGAYAVWAYRPLIRYDSWKVSAHATGRWTDDDFDASHWPAAPMPARMPVRMLAYELIPYRAWPRAPMTLRGVLEVPAVGDSLWVVVSVRERAPHRVPALHVNGRAVAPDRATVRTTPETRMNETVFDVSQMVRPGENVLAFQVDGDDRLFDLDVYEIRGAATVHTTP